MRRDWPESSHWSSRVETMLVTADVGVVEIDGLHGLETSVEPKAVA